MIYTVHHTCKKDGGPEKVLEDFPFPSVYDPENDKKPFLGEGYYFWDYNEEYAKVWGKNHYGGTFFICESDIEIDHTADGFYLDLAGNRKHLVGFIELLMEFELIDKGGAEGIDLCYIIDYLRNSCPPEAFPFRVIRAVDYKNNDVVGMKINFNDKLNSYTILNPRIIISFKNREDISHVSKPFIKFAS